MFDSLRSQRLLALFALGWLVLNVPLIALWDQPLRVAGIPLLPLALFGAEGYGTMLGILATPQLLMNALAPFAFAAIVEGFGPRAVLWVLLAAATLSLVAMEVAARWGARVRAAR